MISDTAQSVGYMLTGFQAQVTLWIWCGVVVLYGVWRSIVQPEPDEIRPSGPVG